MTNIPETVNMEAMQLKFRVASSEISRVLIFGKQKYQKSANQ